MIRNAPPKHPDSRKWYWLKWSETELQNATILTSAWTVPAPLVVDSETLSGYAVGVRLSGGVDGEKYTVANQITTDSGEILNETMQVHVATTGH